MNKKVIVMVVLVALLAVILTIALCFTERDNRSDPTGETIQKETELMEYIETEEMTYPRGEGVEMSDEEEINSTAPTQESGDSTEEGIDGDETEPSTEAETTKPEENLNKTSYESYLAMSPEEQQAFYKSFPSTEEFISWINSAKAEYEENNVFIDGEDGIIDIGDYMNEQGE